MDRCCPLLTKLKERKLYALSYQTKQMPKVYTKTTDNLTHLQELYSTVMEWVEHAYKQFIIEPQITEV